MRSIRFAPQPLNADAVRVRSPFRFRIRKGVVRLDHNIGCSGNLLRQFCGDILLDLCHSIFPDKNSGTPFHAAGFQHRHGQHIPGGCRRAVKNHVADHYNTAKRQKRHQKQRNNCMKANQPDYPAKGSMLFCAHLLRLFFIFHQYHLRGVSINYHSTSREKMEAAKKHRHPSGCRCRYSAQIIPYRR